MGEIVERLGRAVELACGFAHSGDDARHRLLEGAGQRLHVLAADGGGIGFEGFAAHPFGGFAFLGLADRGHRGFGVGAAGIGDLGELLAVQAGIGMARDQPAQLERDVAEHRALQRDGEGVEQTRVRLPDPVNIQDGARYCSTR